MASTERNSIAPQLKSRFHFDWAVQTLLKPTSTLEKIVADARANWLTPLLILTITAILSVLVAAPMKQVTVEVEGGFISPEYQYYSPEQLEQLEQARSVASGPVFTVVFPIGLAVAKIWLGWLMVGAGLHLVLTLMGGRSSSSAVMNMVAWTGLPFVLRDLVRILYMLTTQSLIQYPGLSGFAPQDAGTAGLILMQLLRVVDAYWIWHVILLVMGVRTQKSLASAKAIWSVVIIQILALALQIVPGVLSAKLSQLNIIRPFFF